jgi:tRNA (guanine37-N1)-methyltransferase
MMKFDIFTILPEVFNPYINSSILAKASQKKLVEICLHDIRSFTSDKHHVTDDSPYGGGGGMVMKPEPIFSAVESVLGNPPVCPVVLLSPQGKVLDQKMAYKLVENDHIALICGRYEGFDERIREHLVTEEISIGDYVLTGGELPAMILVDVLSRLIPGVLGDPDGAMDDSHASGLLEYPHYTRPPEYRGWIVPEVLISGNHAEINRWRRQQALLRTMQRRPDMIQEADLTAEDKKFLQSIQADKPDSPKLDEQ